MDGAILSSVNFSFLVLIPIPTTKYLTFSLTSLVWVKIPPIFLLLNVISFGSLIFKLISYWFLKISTIIFAIFIVSPSNLWILQFVFIKNENAILFASSVCQTLPCVPIPLSWISANTKVPSGVFLFSINLQISFCVESIFL